MDQFSQSDNLSGHGGNLAAAHARFGTPPDGWLDLSTGINPHSYPIPDLPPELWHNLPGEKLQAQLLDAASRYFGVPPNAPIIAAPGTQALIQWLPRLRAESRVAVLEPTYSEHAQAWRLAGHAVTGMGHLDDAQGMDADVVVVVNPNNPDGRVIASETLLDLRARLNARGGWLVIDEAFGDVAPEMSLAAHGALSGLVLLRSFGKFFGLAGARLGFALGDRTILAALERALGPWATPGPTLHIAAQAYRDTQWIGEMCTQLAGESALLTELLSDHRLTTIGGTSLFHLVESAQAERLFAFLGAHGILVRPFTDHISWLRFGLPGNQFGRLAKALSIFANQPDGI